MSAAYETENEGLKLQLRAVRMGKRWFREVGFFVFVFDRVLNSVLGFKLFFPSLNCLVAKWLIISL